jgi:hypothetical protein
MEAEQKPTFRESDYEITRPMDDESLPIKQSVYDEWQESELKALFDHLVHEHNSEFNKSSQSWKPKRQLDTTLESADVRAVTLPATEVSKGQLMREGA